MGVLALALGVLTVTGLVAALARLCLRLSVRLRAAFDAPVRQTFVAELVGDADLPNAVALNSTSFNAARMIGPGGRRHRHRRRRHRLGVPDQRRRRSSRC